MELVINNPEKPKILNDYDFLFVSGMVMPVTVDLIAGDTINFAQNVISIKLVTKPSQTDPERMLPEENIYLYTKHILSIQHREREVLDLTPEQAFEWKKTVAELSIQ